MWEPQSKARVTETLRVHVIPAKCFFLSDPLRPRSFPSADSSATSPTPDPRSLPPSHASHGLVLLCSGCTSSLAWPLWRFLTPPPTAASGCSTLSHLEGSPLPAPGGSSLPACRLLHPNISLGVPHAHGSPLSSLSCLNFPPLQGLPTVHPVTGPDLGLSVPPSPASLPLPIPES